MKTRTTITEITKENLVDLLCTATYGNNWCEIFRNKEISGDVKAEENDCREDLWAKVLLGGWSLYFADYYAEDEDEHYGDLPYEWDEDGKCMNYRFNLQDVKRGLAKAADSDSEFARKCFESLRDDESVDLDLTGADTLMQYIIFGEPIYG
jgi:hypothetical protein